jgi:pimeloyl-ACP methyl ester carboxylesterase
VPEPASLLELPIVIIGGFLSQAKLYARMRDWLAQCTEQPVWVVEAGTLDWLLSVRAEGWAHLLDELERAVHQAVDSSVTGRITLVGHSAGGVMARLFLSPTPFLGKSYCGLKSVAQLITLGSPHYNLQGSRMRRWVERQYPGSFFTSVRYTSVAGKVIRGSRYGSVRERWAYACYRRLCGNGNVWGDGLVPLSSQLLSGSQQIVLEGVSHFTGFGGPWYGSAQIIARWWQACIGDEECSD